MVCFRCLFTFCILLLGLTVSAQVKYEDYTYQDYIKSISLTVNSENKAVPIMILGKQDYLILTFDDLSNSETDFYYRIIHCDRNWEKSDITELEYLDGFNNENIRVWEYSNLTQVEYTHQWLQLPNRDTRFRISGNYTIYVYQKDGDNETPILTRRFVVAESDSGFDVKIVRNSFQKLDRVNQQFDLTYSFSSKIQNPMNDIKVTMVQNAMWNNAVKDIKPFNVNSQIMKLDPFGSINFEANNEFHNFDTRNLYGGGRSVDSMRFEYGMNYVTLDEDVAFTTDAYRFNLDYNGKFHVDVRAPVRTGEVEVSGSIALRSQFSYSQAWVDGKYTFLNKDVTADYVTVRFKLKCKQIDEDVYLYGAFTDWQLHPMFKMQYDEELEMYTLNTLLKQGFYDYAYATEVEGRPSLKKMGGSFFDAEQDYTMLAYFKEFGTRYDKVLSAKTVNSYSFLASFGK